MRTFFNVTMHSINLLGWLYAAWLGIQNHKNIGVVAKYLLDHINEGVSI